MRRTLEELSSEVSGLIKDGDGYVNTDELAAAVQRGIARLSEAHPRKIIKDWTGDGSAKVFDMPTTYEGDFSNILRVIYPFDATAVTLGEDIELSRLTLVETTEGIFKLRCDFAPASAKTLRALFTAHHAVTAGSSTITTVAHEDSVIHWAAAECLRIMAAKAIAVGDSTIGADTVIYQSRSSQYKSLADFYEEQSGLNQIPAFIFNRVSVLMPDGSPYLTHAN